MSSSSIERLVPADIDQSDTADAYLYRLHVERYEFASKFARSGNVLDCACGAGYGSEILMRAGDATQMVVGVDIDAGAVKYAQNQYGGERLSFVCADAVMFNGGPFDTIVSFETIEHVPDPEALIDRLVDLLKPGGTLIASVPVTPSMDINPFHLHDFSQSSFRRMFQKRGFTELEFLLQKQPYQPTTMATQDSRLKKMLAYYAAHPGAALKRVYSTAVDGFCNKYLACAWRR